MPTYEYACKSCGEHLEVQQKFTDDPLTECPACQGPLRKVFGSVGIAFKGSGFYKTDSRPSSSSSKSSEKTSSSSDSANSSSGSEKKTESKSETKSEAKSDSKAKAS